MDSFVLVSPTSRTSDTTNVCFALFSLPSRTPDVLAGVGAWAMSEGVLNLGVGLLSPIARVGA